MIRVPPMEDLYINSKLIIPSEQLRFQYSRSSGPGGQNVNKLNTRVSVYLNIPESSCFAESQKHILLRSLKGRIDKRGVFSISSQRFRSQMANRNAALNQMVKLIRDALKPRRIRKKTKIPRSAIEKRIRDKKARSVIKQYRSGVDEST